jgi:WD40 repeat protein
MSHTQIKTDTIEKAHPSRVNCVAVSADGRWIATGSKHRLVLWERNGASTVVHPYDDDESVDYLSVLFSPDGTEFVSSDDNSRICVWDVSTLKCVRDAEIDIVGLCFNLAFATAADGALNLLIPEGTKLHVFDYRLLGHVNEINLYPRAFANVALAYPPVKDTYFVGGRKDIVLCTSARVDVITKTFTGHTGTVTSLSLSSEHADFCSASDDGTLKTWNIETGECTSTIDCVAGTIWSMVHVPYMCRDDRYVGFLCATSMRGVMRGYGTHYGLQQTPDRDTIFENGNSAATAITISPKEFVLVCGWENGDVSIRAPRHVEMKPARKGGRITDPE